MIPTKGTRLSQLEFSEARRAIAKSVCIGQLLLPKFVINDHSFLNFLTAIKNPIKAARIVVKNEISQFKISNSAMSLKTYCKVHLSTHHINLELNTN
jgi:hypothetical protein